MKHLVIVLTLATLCACGATVPTKTSYEQYLSYMADEDYVNARTSLEEEINNPDSLFDRKLLIESMMYKLLMAKFGYYDREGFNYWFNRLGDDVGVSFKHYSLDMEKIDNYMERDAAAVIAHVIASERLCDTRMPQLLDNIEADISSLAMKVLHVQDCTINKIETNAEARENYKFYLTHFSSRDNSLLKARGVELFGKDVDVETLSVEDGKALLSFWAQIINLKMPERESLTAPQGVPLAAINAFNLYYESANEKDWLTVADIVDTETKNTSNEVKVYLNNFLVGALSVSGLHALFDERLTVFEALVDKYDVNLLNYRFQQLFNYTAAGQHQIGIERAMQLNKDLVALKSLSQD